jgi:hypothetical protein
VKIGDAALHAILKASNGDMRKGEWMIHSSMHLLEDGFIDFYVSISANQL